MCANCVYFLPLYPTKPLAIFSLLGGMNEPTTKFTKDKPRIPSRKTCTLASHFMPMRAMSSKQRFVAKPKMRMSSIFS